MEEKTQGKKLVELTKSEGWQIAREKLLAKVRAYNSILGLKDVSPDEIQETVKVNGLVAMELVEWLKEVEGDAFQEEYPNYVDGDDGYFDQVKNNPILNLEKE